MISSPAPSSTRGAAVLVGLASVLTLGGMLLAVARPEWLTSLHQSAVVAGGALAPVVYVLLCMLAASLHLGGVLVALSTTTFPLWQAMTLSFVGLILGGALTFALLSRASGAALRSRGAWPTWLRRAADSVDHRRLGIGIVARLALGCGVALESFFVLTRYGKGTYALALLLGTALYVVQTALGVTVLRAVVESSPTLAGGFALSPLLLVAAALLWRRRQARPNGGQP